MDVSRARVSLWQELSDEATGDGTQDTLPSPQISQSFTQHIFISGLLQFIHGFLSAPLAAASVNDLCFPVVHLTVVGKKLSISVQRRGKAGRDTEYL